MNVWKNNVVSYKTSTCENYGLFCCLLVDTYMDMYCLDSYLDMILVDGSFVVVTNVISSLLQEYSHRS